MDIYPTHRHRGFPRGLSPATVDNAGNSANANRCTMVLSVSESLPWRAALSDSGERRRQAIVETTCSNYQGVKTVGTGNHSAYGSTRAHVTLTNLTNRSTGEKAVLIQMDVEGPRPQRLPAVSWSRVYRAGPVSAGTARAIGFS